MVEIDLNDADAGVSEVLSKSTRGEDGLMILNSKFLDGQEDFALGFGHPHHKTRCFLVQENARTVT